MIFVFFFLTTSFSMMISRSIQVAANGILSFFHFSLVVQMVRNLPAVWETWVQFLGWEDPLEKGMATQSSILAWRIPWTVSRGLQRVGHN